MLAVDGDSSDCVELLLHRNFEADMEDENEDNLLCRAIKKGKK